METVKLNARFVGKRFLANSIWVCNDHWAVRKTHALETKTTPEAQDLAENAIDQTLHFDDRAFERVKISDFTLNGSHALLGVESGAVLSWASDRYASTILKINEGSLWVQVSNHYEPIVVGFGNTPPASIEDVVACLMPTRNSIRHDEVMALVAWGESVEAYDFDATKKSS